MQSSAMTSSGSEDGLTSAFDADAVRIDSPVGPLLLGVMDAHAPLIADAVSRLLMRSIQDARASNGGHLPDWLVEDIQRNYISPEKVRSLWARTGHRFGVVQRNELIGTIHVACDPSMILTVDRHRINVPAADFPGFKPADYHHVVNISVKHELRRARVGTAMVDGILRHFRHRFEGAGLWVRADPPWHAGLTGLGFAHDPSKDVFLPADAERTSGLSHAEFNALHSCDCPLPASMTDHQRATRARALAEHKLQYVSMTRAFASSRAVVLPARVAPLPSTTLDRYARDWGLVHERRPQEVVAPSTAREVAAVLASASAARRRVTVRGLGYSADGQSLGSDIVLSTERLTRVLETTPDSITVEAGASWYAVMAAAPDRCPPVVPGFPPATVGGTLATAGYSKGSHRHGFVIDHVVALLVATGDGRLVRCTRKNAGWLFEAVLGGFGHFGVIVEATLELAPHPMAVRVSKEGVLADRLLTSFDAVVARSDAHHVTAFRETHGGFTVVVAYEAAEGASDVQSFREYVAPQRNTQAAGPSAWLNVFVPRAALSTFLSEIALPRASVQVIPVKNIRTHRASLFQSVEVPLGELVYGVSLAVDVGDGDVSEELDRLADLAARHGGKNYLLGALPRDESGWRAHLGASFDAVAQAKRTADPNGVLGTMFMPRPCGDSSSPLPAPS
jgi:cytokinin dehydrogenase